MSKLVFFDTETTGLLGNSLTNLENQPQITELVAIKTDETFTEIDKYVSLFNIGKPVPELIVKLTGITDAMLKDAPRIEDEMFKIKEFFADADYAIAHNIAFDKGMVEVECRRLGDFIQWPKQMICTVERTFSLEGKRLSLSKLYAKLFDGATFEAHRAEDDVRAMIQCFAKLIMDNKLKIGGLNANW
jgi:DNA polymerase III alpha subunit (gram-positive type)